MSRALFIGRSVLDVTALVDEFPGPDAKVTAVSSDVMPGGTALNASVTFAYLGGDATLVTSLGASGLIRDFLVEDLVQYGVHVEDICTDPAYRVPVSTVVSTRKLGTRMIINDAAEDCSSLVDRSDFLADGFDLIQLDQYERHFVEQQYAAIREFDGPVILDGGSWKGWSTGFLRLTDIPIVSEVFCQGGPRAFAAMCNEMSITRWAVTRGARGVLWRDGQSEGEIPAVRVDAVDTLGAGDIFHGAFCHAYLRSGDFAPALASASQVAARSCQSVGTRSWMND